MRWARNSALNFIEFRAFWEGGVNRSDITERFGVSVPQASNDLTQYRELAPANLLYDSSAKRYVASPDFVPRFLTPNPNRYLSQLRARPRALSASMKPGSASPRRSGDARAVTACGSGSLRALLAVIRKGASAEVQYQSMSPRGPMPIGVA